MTRTLALTMACLLVGCKALPTQESSSDNPPSLAEAQKMFEAGEIYRAKRLTHAFLEAHPDNADGTQLMARILDEEITRYKEAFESTAPEELTETEQEEQIKTWLERGKLLLEVREYDEAALAVENVFLYDSQHAEASALMDQIKNYAMRQGKREASDYSEIVHTEVEGRLSRYKKQARDWAEEGKWGAARLAVEKILMLAPDDEEALELLKAIKEQRRD